jgi:phosphohistidine phosphatase
MPDKPDYYYDQSAVVPFRVDADRLEVLMITSRKRKRWIVPKGIREPELSAAASAAKEALEEAGIEGRVSSAPIGSYQYDKWGGTCNVEVYTLEVEQVHPTWEEDFRAREWVSLDEAVRRSTPQSLRTLLARLPELIRGD